MIIYFSEVERKNDQISLRNVDFQKLKAVKEDNPNLWQQFKDVLEKVEE